MSSNIVTPNEFIPSEHLIFTKPKVNASGGKSIGILNSQTRRSLMVSTPLMLNWGVNVYENQNGNGNTYSLSLQFPRKEFSNDKVEEFLKMIKDMEEKVKYKERIVFATPGIIKPNNWEELSMEEKLRRLNKIETV